MEKILDYSFRVELDYTLKEAGISEDKRKRIINKRYKEALKNVVVNRLNEVINAIEKDDYNSIKKFIAYSPAGDGCGTDNCYISFSDISDCEDIGDVVYNLARE